ncbi:MAG: D-alanyl-D-alanine carboxypeptidase family protein [Hyphomicrobiaceae bacterium]
MRLIGGIMRCDFRLALLMSIALLAPCKAIAGPALLFEAQSGKVLYGEDIDDQWHPASLTKIMTAYLTFEAIKAGKVSVNSKLAYSEHASKQPPSKLGLPVGSEIELEVALRSLIVKSANDIAVAIAEGIAGSEEAFVGRMNAKARSLGMSRTRFVNANGLPADGQVTTAHDLARLSRAVLRDFPRFRSYWALTDMHVGKIRLQTHNDLLKTFEGADGMKTGFICDSGFNVVASATRDGVQLMAIVLGETSTAERNIRAAALLEHGYNMRGWKTLFSNDTIDNRAIAPDAKSAISIRSSVKVAVCGYRAKKVAKSKSRRQRAAKRTRPQKSHAQKAQINKKAQASKTKNRSNGATAASAKKGRARTASSSAPAGD